MDELRTKLFQLQSSDAEAEQNTGKAGKTAGAGCACVFLSFFTMVLGPVGPILLAVGLGLLIFGGVWYAMASRYDLENLRYELPLQVLDTVAVDLDKKRPISLTIDFRASHSKPFITNVERPSFLFFSYGTKVSTFSHDWLEMNATSVEGHRIKIKVTRNGTIKETPKRKRTKVKTRFSDSVCVLVRPPDGASVTPQTGVVAPPTRSPFRSIQGQCSNRGVTVRANGPVNWEVRNRSTSRGGEKLAGRDVVVALMAAFRTLQNAGTATGSAEGPAPVNFAPAG